MSEQELGRMRDRLHELANKQHAADLGLAVLRSEVGGKLDIIVAKLEASDEQRDRMESKTNAIEAHLKELNGRTRKSEDAIAALQRRPLPPPFIEPIEPSPQALTLTSGQKVAAGSVGTVVILAAFDVLRDIIPAVAAMFRR